MKKCKGPKVGVRFIEVSVLSGSTVRSTRCLLKTVLSSSCTFWHLYSLIIFINIYSFTHIGDRHETLSSDKETPISLETTYPENSRCIATNIVERNHAKEPVLAEKSRAVEATPEKTTASLIEENKSKCQEHETKNVVVVSKMSSESDSQEQSLDYSPEESNEVDKPTEKFGFQVESDAVVQAEAVVESKECLRCKSV